MLNYSEFYNIRNAVKIKYHSPHAKYLEIILYLASPFIINHNNAYSNKVLSNHHHHENNFVACN